MTTTEKILHLKTRHSSTEYTVDLTIPNTGIKERHILQKDGSLWYADTTTSHSVQGMIRKLKEDMVLKYDL